MRPGLIIPLGLFGILAAWEGISPGHREQDRECAELAVAQNYVRRVMDGPNPLDMPADVRRSNFETDTAGDTTITSYVDGENAFGVKVRQVYQCVLRPGTDGGWRIVSLQFQE